MVPLGGGEMKIKEAKAHIMKIAKISYQKGYHTASINNGGYF